MVGFPRDRGVGWEEKIKVSAGRAQSAREFERAGKWEPLASSLNINLDGKIRGRARRKFESGDEREVQLPLLPPSDSIANGETKPPQDLRNLCHLGDRTVDDPWLSGRDDLAAINTSAREVKALVTSLRTLQK